ncbi:TrkH family potassium uptake protein [Luteimonas sp. MJ293]|uniref:TrkH family potassium uptake protein n=1 Tax=Luteimonas sp. MJ146 TaxID=3129240 RepID=UPI0031BA16BD
MLFLVGQVLLAASGLMLLPLAVDVHHGHRDWTSFAMAACVAGLLGAGLAWPNRKMLKQGLSRRQAFILTPLSWTMVAAVGAFPFFFSEHSQLGGNLANSVFESVSGITTTGATVMTGLEDAPPGILLWRALLQWMGGIGIIATAIAILPTLGIGGMQLFRTESSDRSPKAMPRVRQIAVTIGAVYVGLTLLAVLVYWWAGMDIFDAVAHALTSIATGGYSTSDASFGAWDSNGIQWFAAAFMLSGAVPFVLYVRMISGDGRAMFDRQVKAMLGLVAVAATGLGLWLVATGEYGLEAAFRHATFNVVSVISTTGYASTDYGLWGGGVVGIFFGMLFIGGCTGSTSGGIKIFRFEVTFVMLRAHFLRLIYPRGVFPRTYGSHVIPDEVIGSVIAFLAVYFLCYATGTVVLMGLGLDFLTSASGAASALSNVGPGLGDTIGPAGTFGPLPDTAKWALSLLMLLGRLELFTVLVLFLPRFWRG